MVKNSNKIPKYVEAFFKSCEIDEKVKRFSFFMIRYDGVILYHNNNLGGSLSQSSIGALLGGVWQAAKALASFIPKEESAEGYRLSFDTSSQGIYIVPIPFDGEEMYMGLIYHDEVNPGFIKNKMREMAASFGEYLNEVMKDTTGSSKKALKPVLEKVDYLFADISDAEMDKLFSFVKN